MQEKDKAAAVLQANRSVSFLTEVWAESPSAFAEALQSHQPAVHIKYLITQGSAWGHIRGRMCPDVTAVDTHSGVPWFSKDGAQETG